MLQILSGLKVKTTEMFLSELRKQMNDNISEVIERGLVMKDYSEMFC